MVETLLVFLQSAGGDGTEASVEQAQDLPIELWMLRFESVPFLWGEDTELRLHASQRARKRRGGRRGTRTTMEDGGLVLDHVGRAEHLWADGGDDNDVRGTFHDSGVEHYLQLVGLKMFSHRQEREDVLVIDVLTDEFLRQRKQPLPAQGQEVRR